MSARRHKDTRDVFLIVASRLGGQSEVCAQFLEEIRPFERARICSGLWDLVAMDVLDTRELPHQSRPPLFLH